MCAEKHRTELLPADALKGKRLGISVSESPDLDRLGLTEVHFRMTLGELARTVVIAGGDLYYGGHLQPEGLTAFLIDELHRYGRRDRPLKVCLAWTVHRRMSGEQIAEQRELLGLFGEIRFLAKDGNCIDGPIEAPIHEDFSQEEQAEALTSLRNYMTAKTDARIVFGGKRVGFDGAMPGVVEEVLLSLERRQPIFLSGGFGGATVDIIRSLRPDYADWFPPEQDGAESDVRLLEGLKQIAMTAEKTDWDGFENGLSVEENGSLAASYRPSEIATFVGRGLARLLTK